MPSNPRILIVDDEPDACTSLRRILRLDGYDVDVAQSVAEVLSPREWSEYFAILLDRKLPDGTAEELLPTIKEKAPRAAIVIITGYADIESSIAALREGAEDYIVKPINPDALRASLARIMRLRQAEERAVQAERLAAIGQVVATMAHESRNFLQRICNSLEFLEEIERNNAEALHEISRIRMAEKGLEQLLEELRQFAAPMMLDKERQSIQSLWRRAWSEVTAAHEDRNARMEESVENSDQHCHIDAFRIGQVFRNLFENALAACGENPVVQVNCQHQEETITITVRDNGPGLDADQQRNVFRPFFTTKTKGTGLGLAIARRIIEAHGGDIRLGHCDDGAEFVVRLPSTVS